MSLKYVIYFFLLCLVDNILYMYSIKIHWVVFAIDSSNYNIINDFFPEYIAETLVAQRSLN